MAQHAEMFRHGIHTHHGHGGASASNYELDQSGPSAVAGASQCGRCPEGTKGVGTSVQPARKQKLFGREAAKSGTPKPAQLDTVI